MILNYAKIFDVHTLTCVHIFITIRIIIITITMIDVRILSLVLLILSGMSFGLFEFTNKDIISFNNLESAVIFDTRIRTVLAYMIIAASVYVMLQILQGKTLTDPRID